MKSAAVKRGYAIRGVLWAGLYTLLVMLPLGVLLLGKVPPGTVFGWDFAVALGFSALAIMFTMFFLTARFRRIKRACRNCHMAASRMPRNSPDAFHTHCLGCHLDLKKADKPGGRESKYVPFLLYIESRAFLEPLCP